MVGSLNFDLNNFVIAEFTDSPDEMFFKRDFK